MSGLGGFTSATWGRYLIDATHSDYKGGREHQELEKVAESRVKVQDRQIRVDDTLELFTVALYEFHFEREP